MDSGVVLVAELPPLREGDHGVLRVGETRVTLDTVVRAYENGATPEEIAEAYSTLSLGDIYAVIGYYLRHRDEVSAYLERRRQFAEEMRREGERRHPREGLRERLLARGTAGVRAA